MSDTGVLGFHAAARRLGVSTRVLREAVRAKRVAAPERMGAVASVPTGWVDEVAAAAQANPRLFKAVLPAKVPAFARYEGTSAWRKYRTRVREYEQFRARQAAK